MATRNAPARRATTRKPARKAARKTVVVRKRKKRPAIPVGKALKVSVVAPGKLSYVTTRGTVRWVKRKPVERLPHVVATGVFLSGAALHAAQMSGPVLVGMALGQFGVAGLAYMGAFKKSGGDDARAGLAAGAVVAAGSWLTAAGAWGATAGWYGLMAWAYMIMYYVIYRKYMKDPIAADRIDKRQANAEWREKAPKYGLAKSFLLKHEHTRLGERMEIDITGTGKKATSLVGPSLEERIATVEKLPRVRVKVSEARIAGRIMISIRYRDPWKDPIPHPLLDREPELDLPESYDITKGPATIGQDPETGAPLNVTVWDEDGARRISVVATSGGGKTVLTNNLMERLTAANNVTVCFIDLAKAKEGRRFRKAGALGPSACGPRERRKALAILRMASHAIRHRAEMSDETDEVVFVPRRGHPAIILVLDEIDELFAHNDWIAAEAAKELVFLGSKGRSESVGLVLIGQRGTAKWMGGAGVRANINTHIFLMVNRRNEMMLSAGEKGLRVPDMGTYGEGHPGVACVLDMSGAWDAGRTFKLRELSDIERLASGRIPSPLEPDLVKSLIEHGPRADKQKGVREADRKSEYQALIDGDMDGDNMRSPAYAAARGDSVPDAPTMPAAPGGGSPYDDDDDGEDDNFEYGGGDEDHFRQWTQEVEPDLPDELRSKMIDQMERAEQNTADARERIENRRELPELTPELREKLREAVQERAQQAADQTEIAAEHMEIIRDLMGRPEGASSKELAKALNLKAGRTGVWRVLQKLKLDGVAYLDPPKGRNARWRLVDDGRDERDGH